MNAGHKITGDKAQALIKKGAVLVDTRDPVSFRDGTLPGAINLSLRQIPSLSKYPTKTTIIMFGKSGSDDTLKAAITYATLAGFNNVFSLGSMEDWTK